MGNNNMMHQREMMNQREMMYQRNMQPRMKDHCDDGCDRRTLCEDDYSRGRDMLYGVPLTMGYVPWQNFECTYEPAQALQAGTIFPELDKPFYGRRGMRL